MLLSRISALRLVKFGCQDNGAFKGPQHSAVNSFLMPLPRAHTHRSLTSDIRPLSSNLRPSIAHSDIDNHVDGPCTVEQSWVGEVVDIGEGKANPPPWNYSQFRQFKIEKKRKTILWALCFQFGANACFWSLPSALFPLHFPHFSQRPGWPWYFGCKSLYLHILLYGKLCGGGLLSEFI